VLKQYLESRHNPRAIEFYLCGPPIMIKASTRMLDGLGIERQLIAFDEF
jgi:Na+-transporting NADH:ubiquinone oxidoreductase subunit F